MDETSALMFAGLTLGIIAFLFIIFLIMYILMAISLYTLAKNNGFEDKAFLAWIPIANLYLIGLLSGDAKIFGSFDVDANMLGIVLCVAPFMTKIPFLGFFGGIINIICVIYVNYNLFKKINEDNATMMTILSFILPIVGPIYLFIKKDTIFVNNNYGSDNDSETIIIEESDFLRK